MYIVADIMVLATVVMAIYCIILRAMAGNEQSKFERAFSMKEHKRCRYMQKMYKQRLENSLIILFFLIVLTFVSALIEKMLIVSLVSGTIVATVFITWILQAFRKKG